MSKYFTKEEKKEPRIFCALLCLPRPLSSVSCPSSSFLFFNETGYIHRVVTLLSLSLSAVLKKRKESKKKKCRTMCIRLGSCASSSAHTQGENLRSLALLPFFFLSRCQKRADGEEKRREIFCFVLFCFFLLRLAGMKMKTAIEGYQWTIIWTIGRQNTWTDFSIGTGKKNKTKTGRGERRDRSGERS